MYCIGFKQQSFKWRSCNFTFYNHIQPTTPSLPFNVNFIADSVWKVSIQETVHATTAEALGKQRLKGMIKCRLTFIFSLVQAKNKQKNSFFLVHPAWKWRMSPLWRHPLVVNLRLLETFRESSFTLWAQTPADTIALKFRLPAKQFLIVSLEDAAESRMESCTIKIILLLKKGGEIKLFFFNKALEIFHL